jgi:chaperonin cofactor prefoldin
VEKMRNDHQRQMNKLNKQINDLTNDKELLEMEMQRAVSNNEKLMERLDISERKLKEHIKNSQNDDNESRRSDREYKY